MPSLPLRLFVAASMVGVKVVVDIGKLFGQKIELAARAFS